MTLVYLFLMLMLLLNGMQSTHLWCVCNALLAGSEQSNVKTSQCINDQHLFVQQKALTTESFSGRVDREGFILIQKSVSCLAVRTNKLGYVLDFANRLVNRCYMEGE